jgi:hypothetical protein
VTQYLIPTEPPRPGLTDLESFALAILRERRGRAQAIGKEALAEHLGTPVRHARQVVKNLVEIHGYPVCSSYTSGHGGYYWALTEADIMDARRKYRRHALSLLVRDSCLGRTSKRMRNIVEQLRLEVAR